MKKSFLFLTLFAAMTIGMVSCSSSDDNGEDAKANFANKLTQNGTTCTWEGVERTMSRSWGNWSDDGEKYAVMRFDRASTTATSGTGLVYYFENLYKETFKDKSEFTWTLESDEMKITYRHTNWAPVHAEYKTPELVIRGDTFVGTWFEASDKKFEFNYKKSNFTDWDKY